MLFRSVIGNSRMLGCITDRSELVRLFWPNIDYSQHIEKFYMGVYFYGKENSTLWLHEDSWHHSQSYIPDTNILMTTAFNEGAGLRIEITDFVLAGSDTVVRRHVIENAGSQKIDMGFMIYSSLITTNPEMRCTLFDFNNDALIHYAHDSYIAIYADMEVQQFQLGNNAHDSARYTQLYGNDNIGMMNDAAVSWHPGIIEPGGKKTINVFITAEKSLRDVKRAVCEIRGTDT